MAHFNNSPRTVIKRNTNQVLAQILQPSYHSQISTTGLFYEVLDLPLSELETKKIVRVNWLADGVMATEGLDLLVPKNGQVQDLMEVLQRKVDLDDAAMNTVRLFESHNGKLLKILSPDFAVMGIPDYVDVYAERIPEDELNMEEGDRCINALHFHREPIKVHTRGTPFRFVVKNVSFSLNVFEESY